MRDLPRPARAYITAVGLLGLVALAWLAADGAATVADDWLPALLLAAAAGVAQLLVVARARGHYSDHLTPAPIAAALLLLPSPLLAAAVVAAFIPEWLRFRRPWFIQGFNIASWLVAAAAGRLTLLALTGGGRLAAPAADPWFAPPLALLVFLTVQTGLLLVVLRLARGQTPRETGLLRPTKLASEVVLLASGWVMAVVWLAAPAAMPAAILPLALIFRALQVPNLRDEASTDHKTGLANARAFTAALAQSLDQAAETGRPVGLLMCDLDFLREVNNAYGHPAGDSVIAGVADAIRETIRGADTAARYGGEEFAVLLPGADRAQAWATAERLRQAVERRRFTLAEERPPVGVTVSIGVAAWPVDGQTPEVLMREADLALYQAKRDGRNRSVVAGRDSRALGGALARDHTIAEPAPAPGTVWRFRRPAGATPGATPGGTAGAARPATAAPPSAARPALPAAAVMLIVAIVAAAAAGLALDLRLRPPAGLEAVGLLLFAAVAALAEHVAVEVDRRGKTSVSAVPILAAGFLFHAPGILLAAAAFAVWAKLRARSPLSRLAFNFGTVALSALAGDLILTALAPAPGPVVPFAYLLLPAAAAGLGYYVVNHALLCAIRALTERRPMWAIWAEHYAWLWPHWLVLGILGALLASSYLALGWAGVLALTAPIGMMQLAVAQYMRRSRAHVEELEGFNRRLTASYEATLGALSRALDARDEETEEHSRRVQRYTELVARRYGLPEEDVTHISRGALLHDIGKIGVPDAILLKPGRLTEAERAVMQGHPVIGHAMIATIPFLERAAAVVLYHHEAYDGTGYPSGLAGEAIPLGARIFALVDTLDAMTSDRPYRRAGSVGEALAEIVRCRGRQFDPRLVDTLLSIQVADLLACRRDAQDERDAPPKPELATSVAVHDK